MRCNVTWESEKLLKISGIIDETATFHEHVAKFPEEVWIDFHEVTRINSCGVRQWVKAVNESQSKIHYINVPTCIVDQMSMIEEFLGPNGVVDSFYANYVCENCGHEETFLLIVGQDIEAGKEEYDTAPAKTCPKCQTNMEFDHTPDTYLYFLTYVQS